MRERQGRGDPLRQDAELREQADRVPEERVRDPQVFVLAERAEGRVATLAGLERLGVALEEGVE